MSKILKIYGILALAALAVSILTVFTTISAINDLRAGVARLGSELGNTSSSIDRLFNRVEEISSSIRGLGSSIAAVGENVSRINSSLSILRSYVEESTAPRVTVKHARLFQVSYDGPVKVVRDAEGRVLLLFPKSLILQRDLVDLYRSKYAPQAIVPTPAERVVLMSATQVSMVLRLEEECGVQLFNRSVIGITWGKQYAWHVPRIAEMLANGSLADFGPADNPNVELIASRRPDLVVIYTYAGSPVLRSLASAGLPVAVDNEYLENSLLGRFEWIKFLALFFNLDGCAERIFNSVEARIAQLEASITAAFPSQASRPAVAWFSIFGGKIYAARPGSYVVNAINLAGGVYAFNDVPYGSVSRELIIARASLIDVLIYSTSKEYGPKSVAELLKAAPFIGDLKAVKSGRVYVFAPTYWQLGTAYPEDYVRDLVKIFYPDLPDTASWSLRFFEHLS